MNTPEFTILLADPDTRVASLTARFLGMSGVQVITVTGSEDVRRQMDRTSFGCVVLSAVLEGVDGIETCQRIRSAGLTPVIVVGSGESDERTRALLAGADGYMRRPYSTRDLLTRINAIVRARRTPQTFFL